VGDRPFVDAYDSLTISTTVTSIRLLNAMQQILAAFPQHATPVNYSDAGSSTLRLRQRIKITHLDIDYRWVGAQSNTIASGDLYNTGRMAWYIEGTKYDGSGTITPTQYLTAVSAGTNIDDVKRVLYDRQIPLSSTAFDSNTNYNVPRVVTGHMRIPVNKTFTFYSVNTSNTTWETAADNLVLNLVSDSIVPPNPSFTHNTRIWFTYVDV
jgi:hypothetical protein